MADSAQDRNLPASERKKSRARSEGQVPRSRDLGHFAALVLAGGLLLVAGGPLAGWLQEGLAEALTFDRRAVADPKAMLDQLGHQMALGLAVVVPVGVLMMVAGVASAVLSGGWNFSWKAMTPDLTKLNPIAGLGRLFAKESWVQVAKSWSLALLIGAVGGLYLWQQFDVFVHLLALPMAQATATMAGKIAQGFGYLLLLLGAFALVDVPLQRFFWEKRLRMTQQEAKQEHKDAEGSAEVKAKIKQKQREAARRRMMAAVPTADLVVMNPSHYAVALKYDEARMGAPRVVAKGTDALALRIRDLAREHAVPVLEAPPLARALYTHVELEAEVPAALFAAVAAVLAWVYQLRQAPERAPAPPQVSVPAELDPLTAKGST